MVLTNFFSKNYQIVLFSFLATQFSIVIGSAIVNFLLLLSIFFFLLTDKKREIDVFKFDYFTKILLFFYLYLILSSILSKNDGDIYKYSLIKTIFFVKFVFYFIALRECVHKYESFFQISFKFFVPIFWFILLDALIQYFVGFNLLGFEVNLTRLSGFFRDEWILGTFVYHTIPLILVSILLYQKISFKLKNTLICFTIILSSVIIYLSGERTIFFISLIYFLFILLIFFYKKFYLLSISILIVTSLLFANMNERIFNSFKFKTQNDNEIHSTFTVYKDLYSTSLNMFYEKKFFGQGVQTFKKKCNEKKYLSGRFGCSSHPHNYYFQILAENGIIGLIIFLSLMLLLLKDFYNVFVKWFKSRKNQYYLAQLILLMNIIITFLPFIPTGNFYSSMTGVFIFSKIAIYLGLKSNQR